MMVIEPTLTSGCMNGTKRQERVPSVGGSLLKPFPMVVKTTLQ